MRIGIHAVGLLVVGSKVLDTRADIILLDTKDIGSSCLSCHNRILGIVLEVTSTERVTHDVECRRQQHIGTILLYLLTDCLSYLLDELGVPCGSQQRSDGEVGAVVSSGITLAGSIDTQSGRTVSKNDGWDA